MSYCAHHDHAPVLARHRIAVGTVLYKTLDGEGERLSECWQRVITNRYHRGIRRSMRAVGAF